MEIQSMKFGLMMSCMWLYGLHCPPVPGYQEGFHDHVASMRAYIGGRRDARRISRLYRYAVRRAFSPYTIYALAQSKWAVPVGVLPPCSSRIHHNTFLLCF